MKNLLITGSSGYVGENFINYYSSQYNFQRFSLLHQDFGDIDFSNVDVVLHCASLVHQKVEQPYEKYYEVNVEYTSQLAKLAKKNGVKHFVFISTVAVYGDNVELIDETTPCSPDTPFGKSKRAAEKQLLELGDDDFCVSIIRSPMVYGKDAPGNMGSLISLVKKIKVIPLGGINNRRSLVYIGNLCNLINTVIDKKVAGVFLGSDDEVLSTTRLLTLIAYNLNKKRYVIRIPFFEKLLQLAKPSLHRRLYAGLEIQNQATKTQLSLLNPYSATEGIKLMILSE